MQCVICISIVVKTQGGGCSNRGRHICLIYTDNIFLRIIDIPRWSCRHKSTLVTVWLSQMIEIKISEARKIEQSHKARIESEPVQESRFKSQSQPSLCYCIPLSLIGTNVTRSMHNNMLKANITCIPLQLSLSLSAENIMQSLRNKTPFHLSHITP